MTREEAIMILENLRPKNADSRFSACEIGDALNMAIKALEQTRWIPVSDRLPEDGIYLVTVERIAGVPRIETKSFAKDLTRVDNFRFRKPKCGWYDYDSEYGCWEDTQIIAWMPLPQPYKGESEVEE